MASPQGLAPIFDNTQRLLETCHTGALPPSGSSQQGETVYLAAASVDGTQPVTWAAGGSSGACSLAGQWYGCSVQAVVHFSNTAATVVSVQYNPSTSLLGSSTHRGSCPTQPNMLVFINNHDSSIANPYVGVGGCTAGFSYPPPRNCQVRPRNCQRKLSGSLVWPTFS